MLARYYSAQLGRFLSVDPTRKSINPYDPQSWNRYSYTLNNPLKYNDPNGEHVNPVTAAEGVQRGGATGQMRDKPSTAYIDGAFKAPRKGGRQHAGLDIATPLGSDVHAVAGGKVVLARSVGPQAGIVVKIDHGQGITTTVAHLKDVAVKEGQTVKEGQVVGHSGDTGNAKGEDPHVHLNAQENGQNIDPESFLNSSDYHERLSGGGGTGGPATPGKSAKVIIDGVDTSDPFTGR